MDTVKKHGTWSDERPQKQKKSKTKRRESRKDVVDDSYEGSIDPEEVGDSENKELSDSESEETVNLEKEDSIEKKKVAKKDTSGGDLDGRRLLFFDFETTDLIRKEEPCPHIIQIGAVRGKEEFKVYIRPKRPISFEASKVNGITYEDGVMRSGEEEVDCVDIKEALKQFCCFISANGNGSELVGHYISNFDCKVLYHAVYRNEMMEEFSSAIKGFIDIHIVFRKVYPELKCYSLDKLLEKYCRESRSAVHDALSDAQLTRKLFQFVKLAPETRESLFSWKSVVSACSLQPPWSSFSDNI